MDQRLHTLFECVVSDILRQLDEVDDATVPQMAPGTSRVQLTDEQKTTGLVAAQITQQVRQGDAEFCGLGVCCSLKEECQSCREFVLSR